jgi:branched-chain amino acid transport system substrate-binding protein
MRFIALCFLISCSCLLAQDTVKIGVILPLTGQNSQVGEPQLAAVKLFEKECAEGHYRHKYQLIVEDDQLIPSVSAQAALKLIHVDHVDAILSHGIAPGRAIAPLASHSGIPMICINASYASIADDKTNFLHWPPVEEEADKLMLLMDRMNTHCIGILEDQHPGIAAIVSVIKKKALEHHFDIVADEVFNSGERDFNTILALIREKHPDTFLPYAISPEIDIIMNHRKQAGLDCRVTAFEIFNFMEDRHSAEGLYYVSPSIGTPEFQARLKDATGRESGYCVAYAYDALNLFRSACETMDKPDRAAIARWISERKDYPSAVGPITCDKNGLIHSPIGFFQIRNGKPVEVRLDEVR